VHTSDSNAKVGAATGNGGEKCMIVCHDSQLRSRPSIPTRGASSPLDEFTGILKKHTISISMDGKGSWMDNLFIERPWKSVKYEDVCIKTYSSIGVARKELT
jgi:hypothetical protein